MKSFSQRLKMSPSFLLLFHIESLFKPATTKTFSLLHEVVLFLLIEQSQEKKCHLLSIFALLLSFILHISH